MRRLFLSEPSAAVRATGRGGRQQSCFLAPDNFAGTFSLLNAKLGTNYLDPQDAITCYS